MFDSIKLELGYIIVNKRIKHYKLEQKSFNNLLKDSDRFLILMPANEAHFHNAIEVLKSLDKLNKNPVVFTQDFRVNMLPAKYRQGVIDFGIADINKFNLPTTKLEKRIREFEFDAVIDLEKDENLFNSILACLVKAKVSVGFKKRNSDKFYSLQIDNIEDNPEIIYKNLLNCLQMF
ncbi:MAG: hypothetical protein P4L45_11740 [Ignavibacteriaceae bacterium]|nr:hypothetical protein [Ignavibacteriaceae bacterium]